MSVPHVMSPSDRGCRGAVRRPGARTLIPYLTFGLLLLGAGCGGDDAAQDEKNGSPALNEALRKAAFEGNEAAVRSALDQGAAVNDPDERGNTALLHAAFDGHTSIVRLLLDRGAEVDARNADGRTALMCAASGPYQETVKLLLEHGADVNARGHLEGFTALMYAAQGGHIAVVRTLLAHGADPRIVDTDRDMAADFARREGHTEIMQLLREAASKK